jgi:hypothetical protein
MHVVGIVESGVGPFLPIDQQDCVPAQRRQPDRHVTEELCVAMPHIFMGQGLWNTGRSVAVQPIFVLPSLSDLPTLPLLETGFADKGEMNNRVAPRMRNGAFVTLTTTMRRRYGRVSARGIEV